MGLSNSVEDHFSESTSCVLHLIRNVYSEMKLFFFRLLILSFRNEIFFVIFLSKKTVSIILISNHQISYFWILYNSWRIPNWEALSLHEQKGYSYIGTDKP